MGKKLYRTRFFFGLTKAHIFGDWSEHKERIAKIKELKASVKERAEQERTAVMTEKTASERWQAACRIKGLTEADILYTRKGLRYRLGLNALAFVAFAVMQFMAISGGLSALYIAMIALAVLYAALGAIHSWFRLSQIEDRALYRFRDWLAGKAAGG